MSEIFTDTAVLDIEQIGFKVVENVNATFRTLRSRNCTNSKMVWFAWNVFVAAIGVHRSKLLGIGIGDQLPPNFCTGCWNLQSCFSLKVASFANERLLDREQTFVMHMRDNVDAFQLWVLLLPKCEFRISSRLSSKMVKTLIWPFVVMARYIVSYRISRYWGRIVAYLYRDNYPSNKVDILHNSAICPWFILAVIKLM